MAGTFTSTGFPVILSAGSHFLEIIVTENVTGTEVLTAEAKFKVYSNRNDFVTIAGTKITGKVAKITNSGAFVEIEEGIDGYLSVDDLSWTKKIKHPGSELSVGKEIETVVLESDPEQHRIRLGVKQLFDDPWKDFCKEYHHGSILEGEIVSITDFGVFVRAPGGIEGLINKANLSEDREVSYEEAVTKYKVGDKISVFVVDVLPEKQKVSFSVRDIKRQREREEMERYMSSNQDEDEGSFTLGDMIKNKK